jgi:hypothetical protein
MKNLNMSDKNSIVAIYESHHFLLVLHGTPQEVEHAKDCLDNTQATETMVHAEPVAVGV